MCNKYNMTMNGPLIEIRKTNTPHKQYGFCSSILPLCKANASTEYVFSIPSFYCNKFKNDTTYD